MANAATMPTTGPTIERGFESWSQIHTSVFGSYIDQRERAAAFRFPTSVDTIDAMRSDPRVGAVYSACVEPIFRWRWMIDPNGARPEVYQPLADDFGLPILGEGSRPRLRNGGRFNHEQHMRDAFLAQLYGFNTFEKVGEYRNDGAGGSQLWHLTKMGVRPPAMTARVLTGQHGDFAGIQQRSSVGAPNPNELPGQLNAEILTHYVWRKENGDWYGRSMLREVYIPWLIKDKIVRVVATMHEKNGIGLPVTKMPPNAGDAEKKAGEALGAGVRAGALAQVTLPDGWDFSLEGVKGTLPDGVGFLDWLNREISTATLTQFIDLAAHGAKGSYALASELVDFFQLAQETRGLWYQETTNDSVIEPWVDINFGASEIAPRLVFEKDENSDVTVADMVSAIESGLVTLTPEVENAFRERIGLPPRGPDDPAPTIDHAPSAPLGPTSLLSQRRGARRLQTGAQIAAAAAVTTGIGPLGNPTSQSQNGVPIPIDRTLRRQPTDAEAQSKVDLAAIDAHWKAATAALWVAWQPVIQSQIDELHDSVKDTTSIDDLGLLTATPGGKETLLDAMRAMYEQGVADARSELAGQGHVVDTPNPDEAPMSLGDQHEAATLVIDGLATAAVARLARLIGNSAAESALRKVGGSLTAEQRAAGVQADLEALKYTAHQKALKGALSDAMGLGRRDAAALAPAGSTYIASEILDDNTCVECVAVDGTVFDTLDDALTAYPSGGYTDCQGGDNCRGMLLVLAPAEASSIEDAP